MSITIRELRKVLYNIQNQDMTIRELRKVLFAKAQNIKIDENKDITNL